MNIELYNKDLEKYYEVLFIDWDLLKNKTILISGITGLIGRYLCDLIMLANNKRNLNCKIIGLSRDKEKAQKVIKDFNSDLFIYINQDVCKPIKYKGIINYVIHTASNTSPIQYLAHPIETINTNFVGTNNLLNLSYKKKSKFILLSSFEVYGKVDNLLKISESDYGTIDNLKIRSCYPESKRISENLCIAYSSEKNVNVSILRLSRVFGPTINEKSTLSISQFIKSGLNSKDIVLKSNGEQLYSFNYVGDVVTAIIKIMLSKNNCEAYNVSDEKFDCKLKDFANYVCNFSNTHIMYDIPNDKEINSYSNTEMTLLNNSKLKSIGWYSLDNIEKKIQDTLNILK